VNDKKILVTAALPYANGKIHLGHLAGAYLPADMYVRYQRLQGRDVLFVCGSDEHGAAITIAADKEKVEPKVIIDRYHEANKRAFELFGMSFDIYSRTSLPEHYETAREFFLEFYERGLLKEKKTLQFFDEKAKMFLPDRYVEGVCPNCGYDKARSDECEKCGALYDPSELKNPVSAVSGSEPVRRETSHWYFPLGEFQPRLEEYVADRDKKFGWRDNVLQYCRGWFKDGLRDRAITRDLDWGVPVPIENAEGKVIYVWFDAVLGYVTAAKILGERRGDPDLWKRYWQDPDTKYVAFIGKDNVVFHCIIFPSMLMAWNDGGKAQYTLPQNVPANEFLNFEGAKFSKSRGWGVDADEFLERFPADSLRYTLAVNMPETRDADFYWKDFQARHNNELADILGNFVNRTLQFLHKHFEGVVPAPGAFNDLDKAQLEALRRQPEKAAEKYEAYRFKEALAESINLARAGNKYFNDSEPWKSVKSDKEQCGTTLYVCVQTIYALATILSPVVPEAAKKMAAMLDAEIGTWEDAGTPKLKAGRRTNKPSLLFTKIEDEAIEKEIARLGKTDADKPKPEEERIGIDEFARVKIRIAEIVAAEPIKKSDKLLKLRVDLGDETRQIVAGVAKQFSPEELVGKKVAVVANLKPAKLMGVESQGMILAAEGAKNSLALLEVPKDVPNGAKIR
jgi:methionyl-tRNA synthetase